MNNTRRAFLLAFSLLIALAFSSAAHAQKTDAHAAAVDPLAMLPASDVVLVIDHGRIWNEALPRFFSGDMSPLSKIMAEVEQFKLKTGVDVRSISRIAIGARFINPEAISKNLNKKDVAVVVIAQGDFNPGVLIAAMRRDMKERVHEQKHGGLTIYTIDEPGRSNASEPDIEKIAVAVLDANTVAAGDLVNVRATIDAKGGSGRLSPELASLAARNSNALISLAGNVPASLTASLAPKGSSGNAELDATFNKFFDAVASIKQMYFSTGMTATGIEAQLGARFGSADKAQSLGDMLLGARQQYSVFIEDKMIRDLVNSMQITAQGDEVQLRGELPQTVITMMLRDAKKKGEASSTSTAPAKATPAQAATPVTQPKKKTRRSTRRKRG
jgi:hypothetical protein